MTYRLRVRNVGPVDRGEWATLVKRMRGATGMSGAELSRRLKVDRATIWRWETGKQRPENLALVQAFAELFGMALDEALTAAGLRPAEVPIVQDPVIDESLRELNRMLMDPQTSAAKKAQIRATIASIMALIEEAPAVRPARRPRKAG